MSLLNGYFVWEKLELRVLYIAVRVLVNCYFVIIKSLFYFDRAVLLFVTTIRLLTLAIK